jgi:hypothetical protein
LETEYVDRFFDTGELRLSTFNMFRRHPDERCRDDQEGKVLIDCVTADGREMIGIAAFGLAAYVLCGTTVESAEMQRRMQRDSFFRIMNTTGFAFEVAQAIPGFTGGGEGFCIYQDGRKITKYGTPPIGDLDELNEHPNRNAIVQQYVENAGATEAHFLKLEKYRDEGEYRFLWLTDRAVSEPLTIHVPNARQYCQRKYIRPPHVPGEPFPKPAIDIQQEKLDPAIWGIPRKDVKLPWAADLALHDRQPGSS